MPLPIVPEIAVAGSPRGTAPAAKAQIVAATRKRTPEEEKSFWENGENHLVLDLYGPLISQLRLEPGEAADLLELLREVRRSLVDAVEVGRAEKVPATAAVQVLEETAVSMDSRIRELLGQERYSEFNTYRERLPLSNTVRRLSLLLADAKDPLTETQAQSLVQLYLDMQSADFRRLAAARGLMNVNGDRLTDEMIRASTAVLSPAQMSYFEKLEEEQNEGYFQKLRRQQDEGK
jgi:hypothetical protein